MRALFACAAILVAARASADDQLPVGPVPAPAPAPAPTPAPQTPEPATDPAANPAPPADPAYSEKPDPTYGQPPGSTEAETDSQPYGIRAGKDIYIKSYPDRSRANMVGLAIAGGAAVVLGGVGLYFHIDSRSKANDVSAHRFTGEVWTADRQDTYDAANRSAIVAGVFYGLGGAVLLGTAIAYMVTEPKMETIVIHPHTNPKPTALVAPTRGGALVGGSWSF